MAAKLPKKFFHLAFSFVMAAMMVSVITCAVTLANVGLAADFLARWLHAFCVAYPVAVPLIYFLAPVARRLTGRFVDTPFS